MINKVDKNMVRKGRHQRIRNKVSGTADRPRMCVYRSLNNIYVQLIDDVAGNTLVAASTMDKDMEAAQRDDQEGSFSGNRRKGSQARTGKRN